MTRQTVTWEDMLMTRKPPKKTFNKVVRKALDKIIKNKDYHQASPTEKTKLLQKEIDRLHKEEESAK